MNNSIGTWDGWTEPTRLPDPLDGAVDCPICGGRPHLKREYKGGIRYTILHCGCHSDLETVPQYRLLVSVREWNELVVNYGFNASHRGPVFFFTLGGKRNAQRCVLRARHERRCGHHRTAITLLNLASHERLLARREL